MITKLRFAVIAIFLLFSTTLFSQNNVKKVILQTFWWDYKNDNFPNGWANYLTELAPRIKNLGIDAIWIPPTSKAGGGTGDVGYGVFDHYDLGDKFQKGNVRTRIGTKDELLRMFAVMHANGIEVIQDIVPNQLGGAGDLSTGGIDPSAGANNKYKNFRYVCYNNPAITSANAADSATAYLSRIGRFSKNWQNFHNNPAHNGCETNSSDNWCYEMFGPDICYYDNAFGQSGNAIYNPTQTGTLNNGYMRKGYRDWLIWLKKQTGFDGIRLDAAKHYETAASEDWLWNLQNNAGFASGTDSMLAVGEYIGNISEEDGWCNNVSNRSGTFDFNLRGAIKNMVDAGGFFDMSSIPGSQQSNRIQTYTSINAKVHRTVPFVNNHDTYRPTQDASGNDNGWNSGNEIGGHIDPNTNPRDPLAYATIMALDGNPQLFIEDVFVIGKSSGSKRFSHLPTSTTDLPLRNAMENIIWCHQNLQFKNGDYKVRSTTAGGNVYFPTGSSASDLLIIERSNKAIICLNDNGATDQSAWVDSDFPPNTVLKDYSGFYTTTTTVQADKRVNVYVNHVDPSTGQYGYAVWAPVGAMPATNYTPQRNKQTTQEWEMANDIGDSHCSSLGQGGALPTTTNQRIVGKIFVAAGNTVTYKVTPEFDGQNITASLWNTSGTVLSTTAGVANIATPISATYTPTTDSWITIKVRNTNAGQLAQRVWVNVTYTAPQVVNTLAAANNVANSIAIWTGNNNTSDITDCANWEEAKMPNATTDVLIPAYASPFPVINNNIALNNITIEDGASLQINTGVTVTVNGNWNNLNTTPLSVCGTVAFTGAALQNIFGQNTFCKLLINNPSHVNLKNNDNVIIDLSLTNGNILTNNYNLKLLSGCTITGGSASSYVQIPNTPTGGYLIQEILSTAKRFPVGNANYTPVSIVNTGTVQYCEVRDFEDVLTNGTVGSSMTTTDKILKTWEITPMATGAIADLSFTWNSTNHDATFNTANCFIEKNIGGAGQPWVLVPTQNAIITPSPFTKTATAISTFSKFTLFSAAGTLPVFIAAFDAKIINNNANISWVATNEIDIIKYQIEKSTNGIDFIKIGETNANHLQNYNFIDQSFSQNSYYKLTIVGKNGNEKFSNIIYLRKSKEEQSFKILPNPAHNFCNIITDKIDDNENVSIKILNSVGSQIFNINGKMPTLKPLLINHILSLPNHIYFIQINTSATKLVTRLIKN